MFVLNVDESSTELKKIKIFTKFLKNHLVFQVDLSDSPYEAQFESILKSNSSV